jgi:hypothetical protein
VSESLKSARELLVGLTHLIGKTLAKDCDLLLKRQLESLLTFLAATRLNLNHFVQVLERVANELQLLLRLHAALLDVRLNRGVESGEAVAQRRQTSEGGGCVTTLSRRPGRQLRRTKGHRTTNFEQCLRNVIAL